jgi:hypothetical protein
MRFAWVILFACSSPAQPSDTEAAEEAPAAREPAAEPVAREPAAAQSWSSADFDGDTRIDRVLTDFSGGAHCCYHVSIALATGVTHELPFELDGGYVFGLDTSEPERFNVADFTGDGVLDLCMQINTYNGEPSEIPREWIERWNLTSHVVVIYFADGELQVRSRSDDCSHPAHAT